MSVDEVDHTAKVQSALSLHQPDNDIQGHQFDMGNGKKLGPKTAVHSGAQLVNSG